jgi:pullulanase/glycogen debranching enzyme
VVLRLPEGDAARAPDLLKGQLALSVADADGRLLEATGVQTAGVLDDLFATDAPLGASWDGDAPALAIWAPTARSVRLHLFDTPAGSSPSAVIEMSERDGVWRAAGRTDWKWRYYAYEVEVYVPGAGRVERSLVADPYSRSVSADGARSQLVDLEDSASKPEGWDGFEKPRLEAPEDIVIYEQEVREFSARDPSVPERYRGTYMAFAVDSEATRHLRSLADAGLTHLDLLPIFDVAGAVRGGDAPRCGPVHFGVPRGSHSTAGDAFQRIIQFRRTVKALSAAGLRVVIDVDYGGLPACGGAERPALDRIVPDYYVRLDADGSVEADTSGWHAATEHVMMERLMRDDLVHWARDYKIDGFRFRRMGLHLRRSIERARDALRALRPERDGVDGSKIYLFGDGWDLDGAGRNARGVSAVQRNMARTGVGTLNDRSSDAARGGGPRGDRREQGFITGRYTDPNGFNGDTPEDLRELLRLSDLVRFGLAGNLKGYRMITFSGRSSAGSEIERGPYAAEPDETINYVSIHGGETLFDKINDAAPESLTVDDLVRMHNLGVSLVALGQGIPCFPSGVEVLRSSSADRGGAGRVPGPEQVERALSHFRELLQVRKSSPLFRLRSSDEVRARVRFHNTGPNQIPGLIVMSVSDEEARAADLDPEVEHIVVLFNASDDVQTIARGEWAARRFELHPIQAAGGDETVKSARFDGARGAFTVPPRTAAVFLAR